MSSDNLPTIGTRTNLDPDLNTFLNSPPNLLPQIRRREMKVWEGRCIDLLPRRRIYKESGCQVYAVEYRLAPEWRFPTQLDESVAVAEWLQGQGGKERGVNSDKVMGGGDSAGGNMTAGILLYPEARLPFDTKAAAENNSGLYLECNGIFSFADHYLPRGTPPSHPYVSPGMQSNETLKNVPPAVVFTCGFDPLRDVGVEYGTKLKQVGNQVAWHHFDTLTHGFLQFAPWSVEAMNATKLVGSEMRRLAYGE
ncbi:hypothetical protein EG329_000546 [Mollisiaceae sp. DMI_Dod_QoI]|nr:hypothetical protein EG329_000546 [Helotiales sp. DMI_Dod_QoI]